MAKALGGFAPGSRVLMATPALGARRGAYLPKGATLDVLAVDLATEKAEELGATLRQQPWDADLGAVLTADTLEDNGSEYTAGVIIGAVGVAGPGVVGAVASQLQPGAAIYFVEKRDSAAELASAVEFEAVQQVGGPESASVGTFALGLDGRVAGIAVLPAPDTRVGSSAGFDKKRRKRR